MPRIEVVDGRKHETLFTYDDNIVPRTGETIVWQLKRYEILKVTWYYESLPRLTVVTLTVVEQT